MLELVSSLVDHPFSWPVAWIQGVVKIRLMVAVRAYAGSIRFLIYSAMFSHVQHAFHTQIFLSVKLSETRQIISLGSRDELQETE